MEDEEGGRGASISTMREGRSSKKRSAFLGVKRKGDGERVDIG